jgi:hypothetical protein
LSHYHTNDSGVSDDTPQYLRLTLYLALLLNLIAFYCFSKLPLTLDEAGTYITIFKGIREAIQRSLENPQQHPFYYTIMSLWIEVGGVSEIALRVPSYLFYLLALLSLTFFFGNLVTLKFAYIFLILILADPFLLIECACRARPYALAFMFFSASLFFLSLWKKKKNLWNIHILLSILLFSMSVYAHLLTAVAGLVPLFYLLVFSGDRKYQSALIFVLLTGVLISPLLFQTLDLYSNRTSYVMVHGTEDVNLDLYLKSMPVFNYFPLSFFACSILMSSLTKPFWRYLRRNIFYRLSGNFTFFLLWLVLPAFAFLLSNYALSTYIFLKRYLFWLYPAQYGIAALFLLAVGQKNFPLLRSILIYLALSSAGTFFMFTLIKDTSSWKDISTFVGSLTLEESKSRVFLAAPYVEGFSVDELEKYHDKENFIAPFMYYKLSMPLSVIPLSNKTVDLKEYLASILTREIKEQEKLIFIFSGLSLYNDDFYQMEQLKSYQIEQVRMFDDSRVVIMKKGDVSGELYEH